LLYQLSYGILSVFESDAKVEFLLIYAKLLRANFDEKALTA
jgi:hypothetical protein